MTDPVRSPLDGSLSAGQRIGLLETAHIELAGRVDRLEGWRDEFRGAFGLIKFITGASLITSIVAITTLLLLLTGRR